MTDMTGGEIQRVVNEDFKFKEEEDALVYGAKRVAERIAELRGERETLARRLAHLQFVNVESEKFPRGRRMIVNDTAFPGAKYNPHRRLAVMMRSFL